MNGLDHNEQKVLAGYKTAVDLSNYEADGIWARNNAMILANSILLSAAVNTLSSKEQLFEYLVLVLAIAGIVLCVLWLKITMRGFSYQNYYIAAARNLEKKYLGPEVTTITKGEHFGNGEIVFMSGQIDGEQMHMHHFSTTNTRTLTKFMIDLFIFLYLALFIFQVVQKSY